MTVTRPVPREVDFQVNTSTISCSQASAMTALAIRQMAKATILLLNIGSASAFWRLECDGSVGLARMDPLMDFGRAADHVHTIKGGSGKFSPQLALCNHTGRHASYKILQDITVSGEISCHFDMLTNA